MTWTFLGECSDIEGPMAAHGLTEHWAPPGGNTNMQERAR
jgi:hypothetical protein